MSNPLSISPAVFTAFITSESLMFELGEFKKFLLHNKFTSAQFLQQLTLTHTPKKGAPKLLKMYAWKKQLLQPQNIFIKCILLPRQIFETKFMNLRNQIQLIVVLPLAVPITLQLQIKLFENQNVIVSHIMENYFSAAKVSAGISTCVLNFMAGQGKTFIAAGLIAALKVKTLYITPRIPLCEQAIKDLRAAFDDSAAVAFSDIKSGAPAANSTVTDAVILCPAAITIIVINSALLQPAKFFQQFSFIIFDEVHMYCSEMRKEIFWRAHARYNLAMSATTEDRLDAFDPFYYCQFGQVIHAEDIAHFSYDKIRFNCTVHAIHYHGPAEFIKSLCHESQPKTIFTPYMIEQFLADPWRTQLIIDEITKLYNWSATIDGQVKKHFIYVFCETRDDLLTIKQILEKQLFGANNNTNDIQLEDEMCIVNDDNNNNDNSATIGNFVGGISLEQINQVISDARIVLTTYGYSGTGVSIPKMTAMLFMTPRRSNMKQILPRIMRRGGDLSIPRIIIDIIDSRTALRGQYTARQEGYAFYNMTIKEIGLHHEKILPCDTVKEAVCSATAAKLVKKLAKLTT